MFENTPYFGGMNGTYYNSNFQQPQRINQGYMQTNNPYAYNTQLNNQNNNNNSNPNQMMIQPAFTLKGRVVTNAEEVKAILIEPDGNIYYFPCPAENCIYTKTIDMNAQSIINVYRLGENKLPVYADTNSVKDLENRIANLENYIKGGMQNVQSNANNGTNEPTKGQQ